MKKRLSQSEEFEIMKLVLDKFLWLGVGLMGFGLYEIITGGFEYMFKGIAFMVIGALTLILFLILIIGEFEIIR